MKSLYKGFLAAFSFYSAVPVPKTDWDEASVRYALCFFPLIGALIGALQMLWLLLAVYFKIVPALFAAGAILLPLIVTGGIHLDGWIDTCDALASHAGKEKKHEILKDPHVGAFGVIFCAAYLLCLFGLWQQLFARPGLIVITALGHIASRALNGLSIAAFPCANNSGLVFFFNKGANRKAAKIVCAAFAAGSLAGCALASPLWGGMAAALGLIVFCLHYRFCLREFGGNSGDLAGFLLQNLEAAFLLAAAIGGTCS